MKRNGVLLTAALATFVSASNQALAAQPTDILSQCKAELKEHVVNEFGTFTKANESAINKNCKTKPKQWLCFVREVKKRGGVSLADQGYIEQDCGLR